LAVEKNQALVVVGLIFVALHAIFMIEDAGSGCMPAVEPLATSQRGTSEG
jgi:hypothetical protein